MIREAESESGRAAAVAVWAEFLRSRDQRLTTPRRVVLEAALSFDAPFTAEELLAEARKIDGLVSLPTIYRNLPLLVESGILHDTRAPGDSRRYAIQLGDAVDMRLVDRESGRETPFQDDCLRLRMLLLARQHGLRANRIDLRIEGAPRA